MITLSIIIILIVLIIRHKSIKKQKKSNQPSTEELLAEIRMRKEELRKQKELRIKAALLEKEKQTTNIASFAVKATTEDEAITDIIDITETQPLYLNKSKELTIVDFEKGEVPHYPFSYVYSTSDLISATANQKKFYYYLKDEFLKGKAVDVNGNSNYYFILMYDLLAEYNTHQNFDKIASQLMLLSKSYEKTHYYCQRNLFDIINHSSQIKFPDLSSEIKDFVMSAYSNAGLAYKYSVLMEINEEDKAILQNLSYRNENSFTKIQFFEEEIVKLFLWAIKELKTYYTENGTSLEQVFNIVGDIVAKKEYRYRRGSNNYNYCLKQIQNDIFILLFNNTDNFIRNYYYYNKKANIRFKYSFGKEEYESQVLDTFLTILSGNKFSFPSTDLNIERKLNSLSSTRWKLILAKYNDEYSIRNLDYLETVKKLANENQDNHYLENIYYDSFKFISQHNKSIALELYLYYLYADLKSEVFDNKLLNKSLNKKLFENDKQITRFKEIVDKLIKAENKEEALESALISIREFYKTIPKTITLEKEKIKSARDNLSNTVELLNQYLEDGESEDTIEIDTSSIIRKTAISKYNPELIISSELSAIIEFIVANDYEVPSDELDCFAKENKLLISSSINNINELCYDLLDDNLIEEDENVFKIGKEYYKQLCN